MSAVPIIAVAPGVDVPDAHAQRTVNLMIAYLDRARREREPQIRAALRIRPGGNPVAQRRWIMRAREAAGPAALAATLIPMKRGRFILGLDLWVPSDSARPRIWVGRFAIIGKGPGRVSADIYAGYEISNHALVRLTQRCGARDPQMLLTRLGALSGAITRRTLTGDPWKPGEVETVTFEGGRAVAVCEDGGSLVVVTAKEP